MKSILKFIGAALAGVLLLAALFFASALAGTIWTSPGGSVSAQPSGEHTIYVLSNGFHTDIAVPIEVVTSAGAFPITEIDLPGGFDGVEYLVVGWGSRAAYTQVGPLSDLTPAIALQALAFDTSVMHVLPFYGPPVAAEGVYRLQLDDDHYQSMINFISETFATDSQGKAIILDGVTQGFGDVFYEAKPRFSLFYGCNAWTGRALRRAGVPIGRWTPFAQSLEWGLQPYHTAAEL